LYESAVLTLDENDFSGVIDICELSHRMQTFTIDASKVIIVCPCCPSNSPSVDSKFSQEAATQKISPSPQPTLISTFPPTLIISANQTLSSGSNISTEASSVFLDSSNSNATDSDQTYNYSSVSSISYVVATNGTNLTFSIKNYNISTLDDSSSPQYRALTWLNMSLMALFSLDQDTLPDSRMIEQKYALATFFYSTNGTNWVNHRAGTSRWLSLIPEENKDDVCTWDGVQCGTDDENLSYVKAISLPSNNLQGTLPYEFASLTGLKELFLQSNHMTGTIPESFGDLVKLESLDLYQNKLSGSIPKSFENLNNLKRLDLSENELTGIFPQELTSLNALERLWLFENNLASSLPEEIMNLSLMQDLRLNSNSLTGSLVSNIGELSNLEILYLNDNALVGEIPSTLVNLAKLGKWTEQ